MARYLNTARLQDAVYNVLQNLRGDRRPEPDDGGYPQQTVPRRVEIPESLLSIAQQWFKPDCDRHEHQSRSTAIQDLKDAIFAEFMQVLLEAGLVDSSITRCTQCVRAPSEIGGAKTTLFSPTNHNRQDVQYAESERSWSSDNRQALQEEERQSEHYRKEDELNKQSIARDNKIIKCCDDARAQVIKFRDNLKVNGSKENRDAQFLEYQQAVRDGTCPLSEEEFWEYMNADLHKWRSELDAAYNAYTEAIEYVASQGLPTDIYEDDSVWKYDPEAELKETEDMGSFPYSKYQAPILHEDEWQRIRKWTDKICDDDTTTVVPPDFERENPQSSDYSPEIIHYREAGTLFMARPSHPALVNLVELEPPRRPEEYGEEDGGDRRSDVVEDGKSVRETY